MATAVYLSNQSVIVMEGHGDGSRVVVQKLAVSELPAGTVLNGAIVNEGSLIKCLKKLWAEYGFQTKKVFLTVNGPQIYTRLVRLPLVSEKKFRELLALEFGTNEQLKNAVYDYCVLSGDRKTRMSDCLASAAESETLDKYVNVFAEAGISLSGIGSVIDSQSRMLPYLSCVQGRNAIMQIIEGDSLISMLLLEGQPIHFNVSRIFSKRGTDEFAAEMGRNANTLVQYFRTMHKQKVVTQVYFGGLYKEEEKRCEEVLGSLGLEASLIGQESKISMPTGTDFADLSEKRHNPPVIGDYLFLAGHLLPAKTGRKQMNLCEQLKRKRLSTESSKRKLLYPYLLVVLLGALAVGAMAFRYVQLRNRVQEIEDALQEALFNQNYRIAAGLIEENEELSKRVEAVNGLSVYLSSYPLADSELLRIVEESALADMQVEITGYESVARVLSVSATAARPEDCAAFVEALWKTGRFEDISYQGYSQTANEEYTLSLEAVLIGGTEQQTDKEGETL